MAEESRFKKWSDKKLEASQQPPTDPSTPEAETPLPTVEPETIPEDLIDLEINNLTSEFDFSRFLKDDVPEFLRRKALRQMWRTNPILANLDGLNEYDEDYTDAAVGVEAMKGVFEQTLAKLKQTQQQEKDAQNQENIEEEDTPATVKENTIAQDQTDNPADLNEPPLVAVSKDSSFDQIEHQAADYTGLDREDEEKNNQPPNLLTLARHGWFA